MKNNYYTLEKKINTRLAALPADRRPTCEIAGQHIQSVAYSANGYFEARTTNGYACSVEAGKAEAWLS